MFARAALSARTVSIARPASRKMAIVTNYKAPTMADLPIPQGKWQDLHTARQRKHNLLLVAGILVAGSTFAFAKESELIRFGWGPKIGN